MLSKIASLTAFMSILLFAAAADSIMDALGGTGFLIAGAVVMGVSWLLVEVAQNEHL